MGQPLYLNAYAKVNLGLDVLGKRPDGYHEVRMVMQTVRLYDRIIMERNDSGRITLETNLPYLPTNEKNLVYRAIDTIRREYAVPDGVHAVITKHIPVAAGMAGGSSDAAAALVGMNQMFRLHITQNKLLEYGAALGADIPYCIMRGTALSEGIGEILSPLPPIPNCWFLIVKPNFSMSTRFVYEHLTLDASTVHPDIEGMVRAVGDGDLTGITDRMGNVLEQVTREHFPAIKEIKDILKENGALNALMSGSGPTVYGIYTSREKAKRAAGCCQQHPQVRQTVIVRPFNKPVSPKKPG